MIAALVHRKADVGDTLAGHDPSALPFDGLTRVELTWIEKKIEHWIRFGQHVHEQILDRRRRVVSFSPHSVFAFARWAANDFGTIISRIDVVRAISPGEPYQTLPSVRPGGDVLLKAESWPKVERVLQIIDAIESIVFTRAIMGARPALIVELDDVVWSGRPRTPAEIAADREVRAVYLGSALDA